MNSEKKDYLRYALTAFIAGIVLFNFIIGVAMVSGSSMEPTYRNGQILIFSRQLPWSYGDVIILRNDEVGKIIIKRVIGMPGDRISVEDGIVYRNDIELNEQYAQEDSSCQVAEIEVPEGYVFVAGDNRPHSLDSRSEEIGCIEIDDVLGVVPFGQKKPS